MTTPWKGWRRAWRSWRTYSGDGRDRDDVSAGRGIAVMAVPAVDTADPGVREDPLTTDEASPAVAVRPGMSGGP